MTFSGILYINTAKHSVNFSIGANAALHIDEREIQVKLDQTALELIGDPKTTLQIKWQLGQDSYVLLCKDAGLTAALIALPLPQTLLTQLTEFNRLQHRREGYEKHRVATYLSLIAAFFIGAYMALYASVPYVANLIPQEWEKEIGQFALDNYLMGRKQMQQPQVTDAMQTIVDRIDRHDDAEMQYKVVVVDDDMVNAFAFPGGFIIVNSALIKQAEVAEEVAAVLSHEVMHVIERHGMRKLVRQAGIGILLGILFGDVSVLTRLLELSAQLDSLAFDREQEERADQGAIKIMQKAGISPQHLGTFFQKIKAQDEVSHNIPEFFLTHPYTDNRIQALKDVAEPLEVRPVLVDWAAVKSALGENKPKADPLISRRANSPAL